MTLEKEKESMEKDLDLPDLDLLDQNLNLVHPVLIVIQTQIKKDLVPNLVNIKTMTETDNCMRKEEENTIKVENTEVKIKETEKEKWTENTKKEKNMNEKEENTMEDGEKDGGKNTGEEEDTAEVRELSELHSKSWLLLYWS